MTKHSKERVACSPAVFEAMIDALYQGITVVQFIESNRDNPDFPSESALRAYARSDSARKSIYASAREGCADALAEQVVLSADSNTLDPQRARNRMNGRQWLAAKLQPKVYGDKLDIDLNNKIDVSIAITQARARAQVIEHTPQFNITTSDIESEDNASVLETNPVIDPFS